MPVIAAYFDVSDASILVEDDKGGFDFVNFPYAYSPQAFSNAFSNAEFNKGVLEAVLKEKKKKLTSYDVCVAGFLSEPVMPFPVKHSTSVMELLKKIDDTYMVVVNNFSLLSKDTILSYEGCGTSSGVGAEGNECDDLANMSIYPQITPTDFTICGVYDKSLVEKLSNKHLSYISGSSITFTGSRFSRPSYLSYMDYILIVDLIKKPGIYYPSIDHKNQALLTALLKTKAYSVEGVQKQADLVGTLLNSPGDTECLISTEVGTTQFFEVKKDNIFISPLDPNVKAKIKIKNRSLGQLEADLKGGTVGLVVDTREAKTSIIGNVKLFNDCVKQLNICLPQS